MFLINPFCLQRLSLIATISLQASHPAVVTVPSDSVQSSDRIAIHFVQRIGCLLQHFHHYLYVTLFSLSINLDEEGLDNGQIVQGTYAYKSSNFANTTNLALDNDLFAKFADPNAIIALSPVSYHL